MKLLRNLSLALTMVVLLLTTTACPGGSSNNDYKMEQNLSNTMVVVTDLTTGAQNQYTDVGYHIVYNYTKATADIAISGLKLPGGVDYPVIQLKDLKFSMDTNGYRIVEGTNVIGQVQGVAAQPEFNSFRYVILDRVIKNAYLPAISFQYTVNGKYSVVCTSTAQVLMGSTMSSAPGQTPYASAAPIYVIEFDTKTQQAAVTVNGAQFAPNMPAQNMTFKGIPYTISATGHVKLTASQPIIPEIGGTPFPAFPILNFNATGTFDSKFEVSFQCRAMGQLYEITANLPYTYVGNAPGNSGGSTVQ